MMKCEICGKECKTEQGLAGHMRWLHGRPGRRQLQLFPTRRLITDAELIEIFTRRDERNHQAHMDLLGDFDKRTKTLLGEIQRLDKQYLDLKGELARIYEQLNKALGQSGKVSKQNKVKV